MSRLFDALKEATVFRENANGTTGDGVWNALGINVRETAPVPEVVSPSEAAPAARLTAVAEESEDISPSEAPVDAGHPPLNLLPGNDVKVTLDPRARLLLQAEDATVVERYRMLRTKIMQEREKTSIRSLVVTSASPQEGKTVTVLNLALSFAMLPSFRVLVIDGDMRRGSLGTWLGIDDAQPGLSNLIDGSAQLEDVILKSDQLPMQFMVRGNSQVPDLHLSQFDTHFRTLMDRFDLVLVDSPPANLVTDVQLLAASCDGVLLVARAFSTSRKALEEAVQNLQPFRVIGTVLNAGTPPRSRYREYY